MIRSMVSDIEFQQEMSVKARPVLLLMVYECMPDRGPEAHAGWERVLQAGRDFEVHAIVGAESFAAIEGYRQPHAIPGAVRFHTPQEDTLYRLFRRMPGLPAENSLAYRHWQRLAYQLALELHREFRFSLVHQVNASDFREPGTMWRLGIPFVWGPVGGTESFPTTFLAGLPVAEHIRQRVRNMGNRLALRTRRVKTAGKRASAVLAANSTSQSEFERAFRRPIELLSNTALDSVRRSETAKFRAPGPLNLLWSGEFTAGKALPLLLEAVANLGRDVEYELHILGDGPLEVEWKALAARLGVAARCSFLGAGRPGEDVEELDWAHLFVSTSLREGSDIGVLQALGHGVPVMCFAHQGSGDIVTSSCGIKVPVTHPGHAIAAMASSIRTLAQDRTRLLQLSAGAYDRARHYLWSENGARVSSIYRSLVLAGRSDRS